MAKNLVTKFVRIGRSGPTVDGRTIKPEWLEQAAKNYSKELFSAPVWPGHFRYYRLGTVEALRTADNDENGVDLFARICPNDYYIQANKEGQRLHTSMELRPNFRKTGEYYLTGLAATDEPASAATSEIQFSQKSAEDVLFSEFVELEELTVDDDDTEIPSWFKSLFSKKPKELEDDMSQKDLEELQTKVTAMEQKLDALKLSEDKSDGSSGDASNEPSTEDYSALSEKIIKLSEQVDGITETLKKHKEQAPPSDFKALEEEVTELSEKLSSALKKQSGTDAGEHEGEAFEASEYI